jgi:hypothetical protein
LLPEDPKKLREIAEKYAEIYRKLLFWKGKLRSGPRINSVSLTVDREMGAKKIEV